MLARDIYTVTRLNREARALLENQFLTIWLEGEISNLARPGSGHLYFSLKDATCQVRCAMFRNRNLLLRFALENGLKVLAHAQVSLYEGRGEFQLIVEHLEPAGDGALRLAFEQLKRKLEAEGLFAATHKLTPPSWPGAIGVITSPTGAAIRDILSVLRRRCPGLPVVIYPVPVQGSAAAGAIARAIVRADTRRDCDVLILARGGGSLEDLWAFNEEVVARAIYACGLPIVTGIGHEIDYTIADLVADRRAATPSAAAELLSPDAAVLGTQIQTLRQRLHWRIDSVLHRQNERLHWLRGRLVHPKRRLQELTLRLDDMSLRLQRALDQRHDKSTARITQLRLRLAQHSPAHSIALRAAQLGHLQSRLARAAPQHLSNLQAQLDLLGRTLHGVSPLATLDRGYAIASKLPENVILRRASAVVPGDRIAVRLGRGRVCCQVQEVMDGGTPDYPV
jgi:exodeoxyribonuclease VII large subunit